MAKILIIEDEINIVRFIMHELKHEGYDVEYCMDGRAGLELALEKSFDVIILDLMLPSLNGIEILRRLKAAGTQSAVIILTARDQVMDKVTGLDVGADDYMTKPFAIEELLARIRVILKRNTLERDQKKLVIRELCVDVDEHTALYKNQSIELTKREFDLLVYLMSNKNIVMSREKILDAVWGYEYYGDTNVVDVYIRYLRSKIDDRFNVKFLHTIRGSGYTIKE